MRPSPIFYLLASLSYTYTYAYAHDYISTSDSDSDSASAAASTHPTVYFIRHGEKPDDPDDSGLNADGFKRAQCLRDVFGPHSRYHIGYIMAPKVSRRGKHRRSYETVLPLARDLGLDVDTSCKSTQVRCAARKVRAYKGSGNILIAWRHSQMREILRKLGDSKAPAYPEERFDLIWDVPYPYQNITGMRSEECPELDSGVELRVQV
ncbi:hypothetical protein BDV59DRAFT_198878 [Aspergillus ambiguus]|uniref:putative phosphoglycerate mutase family protein n=1 Tax=Aspergillus ambiguus TaxID=176160 RepID=UPI003CCCC46C